MRETGSTTLDSRLSRFFRNRSLFRSKTKQTLTPLFPSFKRPLPPPSNPSSPAATAPAPGSSSPASPSRASCSTSSSLPEEAVEAPLPTPPLLRATGAAPPLPRRSRLPPLPPRSSAATTATTARSPPGLLRRLSARRWPRPTPPRRLSGRGCAFRLRELLRALLLREPLPLPPLSLRPREPGPPSPPSRPSSPWPPREERTRSCGGPRRGPPRPRRQRPRRRGRSKRKRRLLRF